MTLETLYKLVGLKFLHEMTPFDVVDESGDERADPGVVEYIEDGEIVVSFESQTHEWGASENHLDVNDLFWINLSSEREIMKEFWSVVYTGQPVKPLK